MCGGGGGGKPPKIEPIPPQPEEQDVAIQKTRDVDRLRRRAAASKTILTSPRGLLDDATVNQKVLLGQ